MRGKAPRNDRSNPQRTDKAPEVRLQDDLPRDRLSRTTALTALSDPVLAELWDNSADAVYDEP